MNIEDTNKNGNSKRIKEEYTNNKIIISMEENNEYEFSSLNSYKAVYNKNQSLVQSETREDTKIENIKEQNIPYKFEWKEGGTDVKIAGTFLENWTKLEKMEKNKKTGIYEIVINIPKGKHEFKFIVDNTWMCSKYYSIIYDKMNNPNNFIDTTNYISLNTNVNINLYKKNLKKNNDYNCNFPEYSEINNESPIPLHYMSKFNLNCQTKQDTLTYDVDKYLLLNGAKIVMENNTYKTISILNHEKLSHICYNAEENNNKNTCVSTCVTQRNRHKYLTIVYYAPKQ